MYMKAEQLRNKILAILFIATTLISLSGCGDDDPKVIEGEYKLLTLVPNSDGRTHAYYLQTLANIEAIETIDNSRSVELAPATGAGAYAYDGAFYLNDYAIGNIQKWEVNTSGSLVKAGEMSTIDLGYYC